MEKIDYEIQKYLKRTLLKIYIEFSAKIFYTVLSDNFFYCYWNNYHKFHIVRKVENIINL